jgi:hypothetical protein
MLTRAELIARKRASVAAGSLYLPAEHAPSPVAIDGSSPLRAQGRARISESGSVTLVVMQLPEGWRIVEERGNTWY